MPTIDEADRLYMGTLQAAKVYAGSVQVWPPAAPAFDPLSIPWTDAYWAEGPVFTALGLANGAAVTTWPSEVAGGAAMASSTAVHPTYTASLAALGARPAVTSAGTSFLTALAASLAQPWSVTVVFHRTGGNSNGCIAGSPGAAASELGYSLVQWAAGVNLAHTSYAGPGWATATAAGAASEVWLNGVLDVTGNAGASACPRRTAFARSAVPSNPMAGSIAFVGYLPRALSALERGDLDTWVASHYGA